MKVEFRMDGDVSFFVFHDTICNLRWVRGSFVDFDLVLSDLSDIRQVQKQIWMKSNEKNENHTK